MGMSVVGASLGHLRNPNHPQEEIMPDAGIPTSLAHASLHLAIRKNLFTGSERIGAFRLDSTYLHLPCHYLGFTAEAFKLPSKSSNTYAKNQRSYIVPLIHSPRWTA